MSEAAEDRAAAAYRTWRRAQVKIGDRSFAVATKPGVFAHGHDDPSAALLAARVPVAAGDVVVHMNCGNGLFGAVAAAGDAAARVLLTDRNVVAAEAARRTLALNAAERGEVLLGHGAAPLPAGLVADVVAIRIPQEKAALQQLMLDAFRVLRVGGRCYVAGATNEGAKSAQRALERLFGNAGVLAQSSGHRAVVAIKRSAEIADPDALAGAPSAPDAFAEVPVTLRGEPLTLFTRPGVFSWSHLDEATAILADVMDVRAGERVLDLGCGTGALGVVAARLGAAAVTMVDADAEAVRCAARTAAGAGIANAEALTSDVGLAVLDRRFDVVVTNPPFHVGKATDLELPMQFIHDAWAVLAPGGRMLLVANRTLPYERPVRQRFGNVSTLHDGPRFKVLGAVRAADDAPGDATPA